jgi:hypothetical protein
MALPLGEWGMESREGIEPSPATLHAAFLPEIRLTKSGQRESNPHRQFGRLRSYRWTMSARCPRRESNPQRTRKEPLWETRFPASPLRDGARCIRNPELTPPRAAFPRTSPAGAPTEQVHVLRSSQTGSVFRCPFHWTTGAVESARLELASSGCRPDVLPLNYDPAGREGIEPSLRVLEARLVTMTLQPMNGDKCAKRLHCPQRRACLHVQLTVPKSAVMAEAVGIEPMYSSRHSPSAPYGSRTRLAP